MATNLNTALSPGCREQQTCSPLARILAVEIVRAFYVSRDRGYPDCSPMWLDDDEAVTAIANIITPTLDKANVPALAQSGGEKTKPKESIYESEPTR